MRFVAAMLVASLAWTACSVAGPAGPASIELGKAFSLQIGQFAQSPDGALRVGFVGVTADSRCPKGEQCVWAGDATAQIWVQHATGAKQTHELHTAAAGPQAVRTLHMEVRLVGLDPYPVSVKAVAQSAHVATLTLRRHPKDAADR